jgi:serine/threonine protein kinase
MMLDHPNVLKVLAHGKTPKGKLFLITEYCPGGSRERPPNFNGPAEGLRFFEQIVAGVAHAQALQPPIYHLDLKPENILLKDGTPVVGDRGICFIEDGQVSMTKEGPRGSIHYCAPELRGPKIAGDLALATSDVYSLGKILYFLFTNEVYDGHEEDYGKNANRSLARLLPALPQFALVDDLVAKTVRWEPRDRIENAAALLNRVRRGAERIEAGGRVLNLEIPQRCLFCAEGHYRVHTGLPRNQQGTKFPDIEARRRPDNDVDATRSRYAMMRNAARTVLDGQRTGIPLLLICDYCGNVQHFRLDLTPDGHGENWRP